MGDVIFVPIDIKCHIVSKVSLSKHDKNYASDRKKLFIENYKK